MTRKRAADLIDVVEASYALEAPENEWVQGILDAAAPSLPLELGLCAYLFDAKVRPVRFWGFVNRSSPVDERHVEKSLSALSEDLIDIAWMSGPPCATASEMPQYRQPKGLSRIDRQIGIEDWLAVCAHDSDGRGLFVGAPLRRNHTLKERERLIWSRISAHITTGLRLRGRITSRSRVANAAAVITDRGKIESLDPAAEPARAALRSAVLDIADARGNLRQEDPPAAVGKWRALVQGKWSLVDHFDRDGKHFLVAQSNEPQVEGPTTLTMRERQVLTLAAHGRENKVIAYELGLSASTVRVHLSNAAQKLGTNSRRETLSAFSAASTANDEAAPSSSARSARR